MEIIVDIKNNVYKERVVRCRECLRRETCVTFEGICNNDGFCSLGVRKAEAENERGNVDS